MTTYLLDNSVVQRWDRVPAVLEVAERLELQASLFAVGMGRAVGVVDLLHAAAAIAHDAVLVHYDADFELLAEVDDRLRQEWVVPRGSID